MNFFSIWDFSTMKVKVQIRMICKLEPDHSAIGKKTSKRDGPLPTDPAVAFLH